MLTVCLHKKMTMLRLVQRSCFVHIALTLVCIAAVGAATEPDLDVIFTDTVKISGWKLQEKPYHFIPVNLYNYINGAADFFIAYGFSRLTGAHYTAGAGQGDTITADIYDMGEKLNAFGVFQSRRDTSAPTLPVGADCFGTDDYLVFYKDRFYVEIQGSVTAAHRKLPLREVAERIAEQLPGSNTAPAQLSYFPDTARIKGSERYVRGGILGHAFLDRGMVCSYRLEGRKVSAFVAFLPSQAAARKALELYKSFLQQSGKEYKDFTETGEKGFVAEEPYHNKIITVQSDTFVAGVYDLLYPEPGKKLLKDIVSSIRLTNKANK